MAQDFVIIPTKPITVAGDSSKCDCGLAEGARDYLPSSAAAVVLPPGGDNDGDVFLTCGVLPGGDPDGEAAPGLLVEGEQAGGPVDLEA